MKKNICPICSGKKVESTTSFTVDYKVGVVLVRDVPAKVCTQCGEEWISDEVSENLEKIVSIAKNQKQEVFVASFSNYSLAS
ncbi:MAG: type II toxin-antitoxin system MqsA family antitoxin [Ignavibacteriales bacterium]|nr:type II toxin-antitoxin system MqsA family antitoxin [Ignavibacteriales bacterium]